MPTTDIKNSADVEKLIQHFYLNKVIDDPIIGFLFTDIAQIDMEEHLPKVTGFWKKVLLGEQTAYQGKMFLSHEKLHHKVPLHRHHFTRWLYLFEQSVDELFTGSTANLAKKRANAVAESMLNGLKNPY